MQPTKLLRDTLTLVQNSRAVWDRVEDRQLAAMSRGFQYHGGLATADEVARLMRVDPTSRSPRWLSFGEPGVDRVLEIVQTEFETIMKQAGTTTLAQISSQYVSRA